MDSIIFDVDGTLWDSTNVVAAVYNQIIRTETDFDRVVTPDDLKQLFGKPMNEIFANLLPDLPVERQGEISEKCFAGEHIELEKTPGTLYDGIEEMLKALSEKYPLYIVSNCQKGYIPLFLRKTGFGKYFKGALCFGETGTSKGQTVLRLMQEHHLTSPVYVGDTQGDADACKEAWIPFIFAQYGFGNVEHPDHKIACPADLVPLCLNKKES